MGIKDWFRRNKQENQLNLKSIPGSWIFNNRPIILTVRDFTDTGVEYPDLYDSHVQMKLYTFNMIKNNLDNAGILGKMYETVAFEAPASWDIETAINNGYLEKLLNQSNAINRSFNDYRQIDVLGRFDSNGNFTYSDPVIQDYVDNTYVPILNEQIEQQRRIEEEKQRKENDPGLVIKALGKIFDFFDGIKEGIQERIQARNEMKLLAAAPENVTPPSRAELGLSTNQIRFGGKDGFYIGNSDARNVMAIDILEPPKQIDPVNYLYTVKRQTIGTFDNASNLTRIANCQFSLPIPPEEFNNFLEMCENPNNPHAKSQSEALFSLLNQKTIPGMGLYIGGLVVNEGNFQYSQCQHLHHSIQIENRTTQALEQQHQQHYRSNDDYTL